MECIRLLAFVRLNLIQKKVNKKGINNKIFSWTAFSKKVSIFLCYIAKEMMNY